jgi:NADPH:quinone reductase
LPQDYPELTPRTACSSGRGTTPELDLDPLLDANITFHGVLFQDNGDRTRALAALLDQHALRPVVSHVLPLAAAAEAHRILEGGHAGGKIVLDVASS